MPPGFFCHSKQLEKNLEKKTWKPESYLTLVAVLSARRARANHERHEIESRQLGQRSTVMCQYLGVVQR